MEEEVVQDLLTCTHADFSAPTKSASWAKVSPFTCKFETLSGLVCDKELTVSYIAIVGASTFKVLLRFYRSSLMLGCTRELQGVHLKKAAHAGSDRRCPALSPSGRVAALIQLAIFLMSRTSFGAGRVPRG